MTKREIVKWLEEQQKLKLAEAHQQYCDEMARQRLRFAKSIGLDEMAQKIFDLIHQADILHDAYIESFRDRKDVMLNCGGWSTLTRILSSADTLEKVKDSLRIEITNHSSLWKQIENNYSNACNKIRDNYRHVICHVQALGTAKKGIAYLLELGFDLTELMAMEEPETMALSVPVDTSYLFLKKPDEAGETA